jgi:hypothetical protein
MIKEPDTNHARPTPPPADQSAAPITEVTDGLTVTAPATVPVITPAAGRALLRVLLKAARPRDTESAPPDGAPTTPQLPENT